MANTTIRPDITAIELVPLTLAGQCKLMAFPSGVIETGLTSLKRSLAKKDMDSEYRWKYLVSACNNYCKDNSIKANWFEAFKLLEVNGLDKNSDAADYSAVLTNNFKNTNKTKQKAKEYVPVDRTQNFLDAVQFENNRAGGDEAGNPFWGYLYASHKKRMFETFHYLKNLYPANYEFCKGLEVFENINMLAETDVEHAENVIIGLSNNTAKKIQMGFAGNPWWAKIETEDQRKLLIKYPFYADIVLENPGSSEFFQKLSNAITEQDKVKSTIESSIGDQNNESMGNNRHDNVDSGVSIVNSISNNNINRIVDTNIVSIQIKDQNEPTRNDNIQHSNSNATDNNSVSNVDVVELKENDEVKSEAKGINRVGFGSDTSLGDGNSQCNSSIQGDMFVEVLD